MLDRRRTGAFVLLGRALGVRWRRVLHDWILKRRLSVLKRRLSVLKRRLSVSKRTLAALRWRGETRGDAWSSRKWIRAART